MSKTYGSWTMFLTRYILGDLGAASWDEYFVASDIFGQKFTTRAREPLGTYSYRTSSRRI